MNRSESLLLQVAEEATEVAQAASKCIRFGPTHTWPTREGQARERLYQEFLECVALVEMCQAEGLLPQPTYMKDRTAIDAKKMRVEHYLTISKELGTVQ
jgi:NTP pyrophosphatase (non-canonical NTP hydrolase)